MLFIAAQPATMKESRPFSETNEVYLKVSARIDVLRRSIGFRRRRTIFDPDKLSIFTSERRLRELARQLSPRQSGGVLL